MEVYYGTNFWDKIEQEEPLKEIKLNREFNWGEISGFIPAIYTGEKGIAIDFCIRIPNENIQSFWDKRGPRCKNKLSEKELMKEHPLIIDFDLEVSVNGRKLDNDFGCGMCYSKIIMGENNDDSLERQLMKEYSCEDSTGWYFKRHMCKWSEKPAVLEKLHIHFWEENKKYPGIEITIGLGCKL